MSAPRFKDVTLRRRSRLPVWAQIAWRIALVLGLLGLALLVHWLERTGLKDTHDGHVSFIDVIYFTMISITTTGYGDIVPVTNEARMFDALIVTPIRLFFVLIFIGTAYTFVLRRLWERFRMEKLRKDLCDHVIVAGFGTTGAETVDELIARGTPAHQIVVVDPAAPPPIRSSSSIPRRKRSSVRPRWAASPRTPMRHATAACRR
jgi:voltage-gated potassium channel